MTLGSRQNPAKAAELERLIAEQAADDTVYVTQRHRSLDAPLGNDGDGSLLEVIGDDREVEVGPAQSKPGKHSHKVTKEQIREWRLLRKDGWTYQRIAEYAGVRDLTVRRHISKVTGERRGRQYALERRLGDLREMYESGAFLREIAEVVYDDAGYDSWQGCYHALRRLFIRRGVTIRPFTLSKRARSGRPAPDAPREEWRRFWREKNTAWRRRQGNPTRCDATAKAGRRCRRFAIRGGRYCVSHTDEYRAARTKWPKGRVLEALRVWTEAHGRPPKAKDWVRATDEHPGASTVCNLFGKWSVALHEALEA